MVEIAHQVKTDERCGERRSAFNGLKTRFNLELKSEGYTGLGIVISRQKHSEPIMVSGKTVRASIFEYMTVNGPQEHIMVSVVDGGSESRWVINENGLRSCNPNYVDSPMAQGFVGWQDVELQEDKTEFRNKVFDLVDLIQETPSNTV